MTTTPKFKPGQLVKYNHPANPLVGLVKSVKPARKRRPMLVLVQWCGKYRQSEEYIFQRDLKLVEAV